MNLSGTVTAEYNPPHSRQPSLPDRRRVAGAHTTVWFAEQAVNQIGRLKLSRPGR